MGRRKTAAGSGVPVHQYALGALRFSIAGPHRVVEHIAEEFEPLLVSAAPERAQLRFTFVDELPSMSGASHVDRLRVLDDSFAVSRAGMSYRVSRYDDGLDVAIVPRTFNPLREMTPDAVARCADWNHLTNHERVAKNFAYDVFDYLSQVAQLPLGQSHLHASSFERDGRGVAILAWGGVGKTSAMLKLVMEDGWKYLSDDLVTIDRSGTLWRSPKRLQVYGYNVVNQARIRDMLMSGRSLPDRISWNVRGWLRGPKKVRRRVSAEQLFGAASTAASATIAQAVHIERVDCTHFSSVPISVRELASRGAATVLSEIRPFVDLSIAMHSTERSPAVPGVQEMYEATRSVLEDGLSGVRPLSIRVPLGAGPDEISGYLRPLLEHGPSSVESAARVDAARLH